MKKLLLGTQTAPQWHRGILQSSDRADAAHADLLPVYAAKGTYISPHSLLLTALAWGEGGPVCPGSRHARGTPEFT